jgi:hypothetical protein
MVVHLLDARGVFRRDDRSPARAVVVDDEAVQVNDAVADGNLKPGRPPVGGFQGSDNPIADVFIIRRGIRNLGDDDEGGCYLIRRRVMTRYGWRIRRVQVCN